MDIYDIYQKSNELIKSVTSDYRAIKAIDLARMRDLAVESALEQIAPITPLEIDVNKRLLRMDIIDPDLVHKHKDELTKVEASVEEKIALAISLLEDIEQQEQQFTAQIEFTQDPESILNEETFDETAEPEELEEMAEAQQEAYEQQQEELSEFLQEMTQAAMEDESEVAKDLTQLMNRTKRRRTRTDSAAYYPRNRRAVRAENNH